MKLKGTLIMKLHIDTAEPFLLLVVRRNFLTSIKFFISLLLLLVIKVRIDGERKKMKLKLLLLIILLIMDENNKLFKKLFSY